MSLLAKIITIWAVSIFFLQNSMAKPPDGPSGGSKSSSSGSKSSSSSSKSTSSGVSGRADRDQQGGGTSPSGGSKTTSGGSKTTSGGSKTTSGGSKTTSGGSNSSSGGSKSTSSGSPGRSDRDQQGGSKVSGSGSSGRSDRDQQGGSKASGSGSSGRSDRDQQGGSKASGSGSSGRSDRDQQGGSTASGSGSSGRSDRDQQGGTKTNSGVSVGRADRDQQGGRSAPTVQRNSSSLPISSMISGAKSLAERAIEIGRSAVEATKNAVVKTVEPHYKAMQAGIEAQKRATVGTLGAGSLGFQIAQERAYYNGVEDYYKKNNIKNEFVPTGPMAAKLRGQQLNELEAAVVKAIDVAYRNADAIVADPEKMSEEHIQQLIGVDLYNELKQSPTQLLGFKNSTVVIGKKREIAEQAGEFAMNLYQNGYYMDSIGVIYVDNSKKKSKDILEFRDLILHESQHAGDKELYEHALNDSMSPMADNIVEILRPSIELQQNPDIAMLYPEYYNPELKYTNGGYPTTLTEMRAFAQTDLNKKDWAENFAEEYDLEVEEAEVIGEILLESPVLQRDLQMTDEYAEQVLGGQK